MLDHVFNWPGSEDLFLFTKNYLQLLFCGNLPNLCLILYHTCCKTTARARLQLWPVQFLPSTLFASRQYDVVVFPCMLISYEMYIQTFKRHVQFLSYSSKKEKKKKTKPKTQSERLLERSQSSRQAPRNARETRIGPTGPRLGRVTPAGSSSCVLQVNSNGKRVVGRAGRGRARSSRACSAQPRCSGKVMTCGS